MNPRIEVFVPGEPVPQPRSHSTVLTDRGGNVVRGRNGRPIVRHYTPTSRRKDGTGDISAWKELVMLKLREQLPYPRTPWDGPVELDITFWFQRTQDLERPKFGNGELLHDVRPDIDNLAKAVMDVMTAEKVWKDDGRVTDTTVRKRYVARGYQAGCRIIARPIIAGQGSLYDS